MNSQKTKSSKLLNKRSLNATSKGKRIEGIPSKKTFKNRLTLLIGDNKPYSWCRKIGIDKGLFQYYWQKGKIPTYDNLIKIRLYTGCSLDWLITGEGEPYPDRIEDIAGTTNELLSQVDTQIGKLEKQVAKLKKIKTKIKNIR